MTVRWKQDPGHGGVDPGAVAKGNTEKVYTLEAALYVNKRLAEHGIESECTRYMDQTLDETPRVASVKTAKKCISHHYNAGGGMGAEFIRSIYSDGKFEHLIAEEFKAAGYPVRRVFCRKGTNGDYYYMHRRTGSARVTIVEYDFVDGANSEKIKDKAYREGMYECVVKAICRDEGVAYKPLISAKTVKKEETDMLEKAIIVGTHPADISAAEILQLKTGAPMYFKGAVQGKRVAKEILVVGGNTDGLVADKITQVTGKDRREVMNAVYNY